MICQWFSDEQKHGRSSPLSDFLMRDRSSRGSEKEQMSESNLEIGMNLKKVLRELSVQDIQRTIAIDLNSDPEKALAFIREKLAKQVKKALQSHWVPVFEASYGPAQKDRFARDWVDLSNMLPNLVTCFLEPIMWNKGCNSQLCTGRGAGLHDLNLSPT